MAKDIYEEVKDVPGWLMRDEARCLFDLATNAHNTIVEIGSWKGKSTICLALGAKEGSNAQVFTIDPHTNPLPKYNVTYPALVRNLKKANADASVTPIVATSLDVGKTWTRPIDFLFIDGLHHYKYVLADFLTWEPQVKEGGVIAFHDSINEAWPEVGKVVADHVLSSNRFRVMQTVNTIMVVKKIRKANSAEREATTELLQATTSSLHSQSVILFFSALHAVAILWGRIPSRLLISKTKEAIIPRAGISIKKISPRLYYAIKKTIWGK